MLIVCCHTSRLDTDFRCKFQVKVEIHTKAPRFGFKWDTSSLRVVQQTCACECTQFQSTMELKSETETETIQVGVAVKQFKFTSIEPHQLLSITHNPSHPLDVVALTDQAIVFTYNGQRIVVVQSPAEADMGRLTTDIHNYRTGSIWWEASGRTDLVFMDALTDLHELNHVRVQFPPTSNIKKPTQKIVSGYTEIDTWVPKDDPCKSQIKVNSQQ